MCKPALLMVGFLLYFLFAKADPGDSILQKKKYFTQRLKGNIELDGILNEDAWKTVEWGGDFIQFVPSEGKAPSQPTSFKILYDDKFLIHRLPLS